MKSFISDTLDDILLTTKSFENVIFVLPSQRAKVFVKQTFKDKISVGFLPEMLNIEQFIQQISGVQKADNIQLLFHFYTIYKSVEKNPDSFDTFSSWAITVLQDFNEIDQHLINTKESFDLSSLVEKLHPTPAVAGFPKKEALEFIKKHEQYKRSFYSGYFGLSDNKDVQYFVNLRCMQVFDDPVVDYATSRTDFYISTLRSQKSTIYIAFTQTDRERLSPLLTIFWRQVTETLLKELPDLKKEPYPVLFLMDEFPVLKKIDVLQQGFDTSTHDIYPRGQRQMYIRDRDKRGDLQAFSR